MRDFNNYLQRKRTAAAIGLNYAVLPLLEELYYANRITTDLYRAAYLLKSAMQARSNFDFRCCIHGMEKEYFTLY